MTLAGKSLSTLLEEFRSAAPTPGGGSAAALAGALGASLLAMVASLPKPRATIDADLQRLGNAGARCTDLARRLEALIDRDAEAYDRVVSAYRLPKGSDAEKAARSAAIQAALKDAIEVPLDVMRACATAIDNAAVIAALGNANASSDVGVGVELLRAGRRGAQLNVEINLESVKDPEYVSAVRRGFSVNESGAAGDPT
jgi:formiminotetrahydrofolate cyclodeaminase